MVLQEEPMETLRIDSHNAHVSMGSDSNTYYIRLKEDFVAIQRDTMVSGSHGGGARFHPLPEIKETEKQKEERERIKEQRERYRNLRAW